VVNRTLSASAWTYLALILAICPNALAANDAGTTPPSKEQTQDSLRDHSTIHGLVVVSAADGRLYGKAVEIIAVAPKHETNFVASIKPIGDIGKEMRTSLEEAVRLAGLRDPRARQIHLEISFDDKYSAKEGGSAATAFTLLILSSLNQFEPDSASAVTGDITVDGKVRPIGAVRSKVRGAALDHMRVVGIPGANAPQLDEAALLEGPGLLWDTQVLGMDTIDDAIAVIRKDRAPKLEQALKLFEKLRADMAQKPVAELATNPEAKQTLARILELAPNHLSAATLQRMSQGKLPQKLSVAGSLEAIVMGLGPMREDVLSNGPRTGNPAVPENVETTKKDILVASQTYLDAAGTLLATDRRSRMQVRKTYQEKRTALRESILKILNDQATIEKLIHGN